MPQPKKKREDEERQAQEIAKVREAAVQAAAAETETMIGEE